MILDEAAVTAERRSLAGAPQPLQRLGRDLQIGRGLVGGEEGRAALREARALPVAFSVPEVRRLPSGAAARLPWGPRPSPAWPARATIETFPPFSTAFGTRPSAAPGSISLHPVPPP